MEEWWWWWEAVVNSIGLFWFRVSGVYWLASQSYSKWFPNKIISKINNEMVCLFKNFSSLDWLLLVLVVWKMFHFFYTISFFFIFLLLLFVGWFGLVGRCQMVKWFDDKSEVWPNIKWWESSGSIPFAYTHTICGYSFKERCFQCDHLSRNENECIHRWEKQAPGDKANVYQCSGWNIIFFLFHDWNYSKNRRNKKMMKTFSITNFLVNTTKQKNFVQLNFRSNQNQTVNNENMNKINWLI